MVKLLASFIFTVIISNCQASSCPPGQLLYETDGKCYSGSETPCVNEFQIYTENDNKPGYGSCHCLPYVGNSNRPVAQWPGNSECYLVFDQGPCAKGEWLLLGKSEKVDEQRTGVCAKRTCPEAEDEKEGKFWFEHNGKCLQVETTNLEFCGNENEKIFFDIVKSEPACMEAKPMVRSLPPERYSFGLG